MRKLVTQLGGDKYDDRQAAQERLTAMGPAVYSLLESELAASSDAETRSRLQAILHQINREDTAHGTPITLHIRGGLPKDIVADIARQADTDIVGDPPALLADLKTPLSLEVDHEPFWKVMVDVCKRTHLTPAEQGGIGERTITLKKGDEPTPRATPSTNGCFHITPVSSVSGGAVANRTILAFRMLVDPKLTVLRSTTFIGTTQVADSAERSLLYKAPFSSDDFTTYYNWNWGLTSHILTPADGVVADFKGTVKTQVLDKSLRWEIDNVLTAKNASRELPFGKAHFAAMSKIDQRNTRDFVLYDRYTVNASFDVTPGKEALAGGNTIFGGTLRLFDAAGNVSAPAYFGSARSVNGRAGFSTTIGARTSDGKNLGPIVRLVWEIPAGVREIVVPVEFKNIKAN